MGKSEKVMKSGIVTKTRKIRAHGTSLYVCLPKEFTQKHNLKKGDEVAVISDTIVKIVAMSEI